MRTLINITQHLFVATEVNSTAYCIRYSALSCSMQKYNEFFEEVFNIKSILLGPIYIGIFEVKVLEVTVIDIKTYLIFVKISNLKSFISHPPEYLSGNAHNL
jgi:hypothetical protein